MEYLGGLSNIRANYHQLSDKQKKIADYILANPQQSSLLTMRELSDVCQTSEATIVRFLQKLKYESYQEFRIEVTKENSAYAYVSREAQLSDGYQGIVPDDSPEEIKQKVIRAAIRAIHEMDSRINARQIEAAAEILQNAKQILLYGSGGSLAIAQDAYHKLLRLGLPVSCDSNFHIALIKAKSLQPGDAAILISHTGESQDLLACVEQAKQQNATVIALTGYLNSTLAQKADYVFYSSCINQEYYTDAMTSRLTQLTILDMIYLTTRLRMGEEGLQNITRAKEAILEIKKRKDIKK